MIVVYTCSDPIWVPLIHDQMKQSINPGYGHDDMKNE
jgi:hypothetical protein